MLDERPAVSWLEVHSENYFGAGGEPLRVLESLRQEYPISFHGVGLSLGGTDPLDPAYLAALQRLVDRYQPGLVSDHLAWSSLGGVYFNDLLPLPYTDEALQHVAERISRVQDYLGRPLLVENPSTYLQFVASAIPEAAFLAALVQATGCQLLIDVNNVYVSASNHGWDARAYLAALPASAVAEIHLAGHIRNDLGDGELLIDAHNRPVSAPVWALYEGLIERIGPRPTLIEWDSELPPLAVLLNEATAAQQRLERYAQPA